MRLVKVISGGQTGVDIVALRAAKALGIKTGGWMPRGWRTLAGARPEYAALYGMREASLSGYPARTVANVVDAHATLRIAEHFDSPGERCALNAIIAYDRPHRAIRAHRYDDGLHANESDVIEALAWLRSFDGDLVLNVAGNSEKTSPGIGRVAESLLRQMFAECQ